MQKEGKKFKIILTSFLLFACFFLVFTTPAGAQGLWDRIDCRTDGDCQLRDLSQLTVNVAQWILGVTGSLALLAFVYGGVLFLVSAGSSERVNKAKQVIIGAVIGVVIVFASYMIIGFIFQALGIDCAGNNAWSRTGWFNSCPMTQQRALDIVR